VQNIQNYAVIWNKKNRDKPQDSSIISVKAALIVSDSRFEMHYDNNTSTYSLKIKDIVNSDAGIYECQIVLTSTEKKISIVELQVRHAPLINEALSTPTVLVGVGEPAELKCFADGYPRPTITWKREYDTILPIGGASFTGNVLKLAKVDKKDRGTYICWADNEVGNPVSKTINLEVEFEPVILVPRPRVAQSVDYEIDLVCQVEAYPAPAISWFRDGKEIHNGDEYR
jgi:neuronal growth regulator 1